jgi:hypothetical protein
VLLPAYAQVDWVRDNKRSSSFRVTEGYAYFSLQFSSLQVSYWRPFWPVPLSRLLLANLIPFVNKICIFVFGAVYLS